MLFLIPVTLICSHGTQKHNKFSFIFNMLMKAIYGSAELGIFTVTEFEIMRGEYSSEISQQYRNGAFFKNSLQLCTNIFETGF